MYHRQFYLTWLRGWKTWFYDNGVLYMFHSDTVWAQHYEPMISIQFKVEYVERLKKEDKH